MGKIIDFAEYRERHKPAPRDGVTMAAIPPYIVVKHYQNGVMRDEQRLISKRMIRELLDDLP